MLDLTKIIEESFTTKEETVKAVINGVTFELGPTSNEDEFTLAEIYASGNIEQKSDQLVMATQARVRTIASMLRSVNGVKIEKIIALEDGSTQEHTLYLVEQMKEWPAALITTLYLICIDLKKRLTKEIRDSVKYDWFGENLIASEEENEELEAKMIKAEDEALKAGEMKEVEFTEAEKKPAPENR